MPLGPRRRTVDHVGRRNTNFECLQHMSRARRVAESMSSWRRIAAASCGPPLDPQIYGDLEIDATELLAHLEAIRRETGVRVTVTHVVGRALGHALAAQPALNTRLVRGRFHARESVDIFFVASVAGGNDVSGIKIAEVDRKSLTEVATELQRRVERSERGDGSRWELERGRLAPVRRPPSRPSDRHLVDDGQEPRPQASRAAATAVRKCNGHLRRHVRRAADRRGWACFMAGEIVSGTVAAERAFAVAEDAGGWAEILATALLAIALLLSGEHQRAEPLLRRYEPLLEQPDFLERGYYVVWPAGQSPRLVGALPALPS